MGIINHGSKRKTALNADLGQAGKDRQWYNKIWQKFHQQGIVMQKHLDILISIRDRGLVKIDMLPNLISAIQAKLNEKNLGSEVGG